MQWRKIQRQMPVWDVFRPLQMRIWLDSWPHENKCKELGHSRLSLSLLHTLLICNYFPYRVSTALKDSRTLAFNELLKDGQEAAVITWLSPGQGHRLIQLVYHSKHTDPPSKMEIRRNTQTHTVRPFNQGACLTHKCAWLKLTQKDNLMTRVQAHAARISEFNTTSQSDQPQKHSQKFSWWCKSTYSLVLSPCSWAAVVFAPSAASPAPAPCGVSPSSSGAPVAPADASMPGVPAAAAGGRIQQSGRLF